MSLLCPKSDRDAVKALVCLILCELLFCGIFWVDFLFDHPFWWVYELFNIDQESNIPTWFSTIQLFLIGLLFLFIGYRTEHTPPPSKLGTKIFGFGFIYLSLDEAAIIHEKLTWVFINNPLVPYFHGRHGVWIVVYGTIAIILLALLAKDLWALGKAYPRLSRIFLLGIVVFLFGSAGMETITFFYLDESDKLVYTVEVIMEEFLEMAGVSVMLYSVLLLSLKKSEDPSPLIPEAIKRRVPFK
ncbi:MAG: hypothetical protein A3C36_02295 [Omnitrophica WOR_2 bacterium RIFCSPHIGHO2_02_FULL_52_10]|nr:MAG: hypothetical protein A3C36_02295 [Omnitrophica WOR_2 bacterium RIFCSPHIGHO2_02_FULL_52_10]